MGRNRAALNAKGGGSFSFRELIEGSNSTTWTNGGYPKSSTLKDDPNIINAVVDSGDVINAIISRRARASTQLMQSNRNFLCLGSVTSTPQNPKTPLTFKII